MTDDIGDYLTRNRLRIIVNRTTELTPLNSVASRAIQLAENERTAAVELATVISSDQALTAKVLKLSNSAYYGYGRRISTVREAVILLGMRTVRSVAIAFGIIDALKPREVAGFDHDLFWAHSLTVGLVSEAIAKETRAARPEDAFTGGVLHDMGKLAMLLTEPGQFGELCELVNTEGMSFDQAETAVFGVGHEHVGARLAQRWKFPEHLVEAIRGHHPAKPVASIDTLTDIVATANLAVNRLGLAAGFDWRGVDARKPMRAVPPKVDAAIAAAPGGMAGIEERAQAFLSHTTGQVPRWWKPLSHRAADGEEHAA